MFLAANLQCTRRGSSLPSQTLTNTTISATNCKLRSITPVPACSRGTFTGTDDAAEKWVVFRGATPSVRSRLRPVHDNYASVGGVMLLALSSVGVTENIRACS